MFNAQADTKQQSLQSPSGDAAALEMVLIESGAGPKLNVVERARTFAALINEHSLTYEQISERVGHSKSTVSSLVRLLNLSEEILGFLEAGELGQRHGRALLTVKDLEARGALARTAVEERWSAQALEDRVLGRVQKQTQDRDGSALEVAKAWGDVLGVEVGVRTLSHGGGFRVEVVFASPTAALASAGRLGEAVSMLQAQVAEGRSDSL
jgi:ParB family transcriptional regulator, chromosome partitioning protein